MNFHGGNIYDYENIKFDFSANINPLGVPLSLKEAIINNLDAFSRYPDIEYNSLKKNIVDYLSLDEKFFVFVGNGAVDIIYTIVGSLGFNKLFTISPTFSEYRQAALNFNIKFEEIYCYNDDFSQLNMDMFFDRIDEKSIVIICNPNNPTGYLIDTFALEKMAEKIMDKKGLLIIDEAFIEFTDYYPKSSFINKLANYPNVVVIRAVTKFFGIPGIRLGYGVTCNKDIYEKVKRMQQPWNINSAAVIAGNVVFKDRDYIMKTRKWIKEERKFLYESLYMVKNLKIYPSSANFYLAKLLLKDKDAYNLRDKLVSYGILIRTPDGFSNITSKYFRIAVLDRKANSFLISALYEILGK